jgi:hypothetical protein
MFTDWETTTIQIPTTKMEIMEMTGRTMPSLIILFLVVDSSNRTSNSLTLGKRTFFTWLNSRSVQHSLCDHLSSSLH